MPTRQGTDYGVSPASPRSQHSGAPTHSMEALASMLQTLSSEFRSFREEVAQIQLRLDTVERASLPRPFGEGTSRNPPPPPERPQDPYEEQYNRSPNSRAPTLGDARNITGPRTNLDERSKSLRANTLRLPK